MSRSIRDCNVVVTGGAGFLGSHLVDHLIEDRGCRVMVIDNLIVGRREFIHPDATFEHCDITGSEEHLRKLFVHHKTRFAFLAAACPYVPFSFERPLHVFNVNAFGAMKCINAAWEAGCEGTLQVSSAELYGEGAATANVDADGHCIDRIDEDSPVVPHSTYAASKAAIDALVQVRWREAQTPVMAVRLFNVAGECETHRYVIPEIIDQLAKGPVVRLGNNSYRDFQYVGDAVRMMAELLERGRFGEVYNMGSQDSVRIYDLARLIGRLMGHESITIEVDPARVRPWELWHLKADAAKLYGVIEYRPRHTLEDTLRRTIDYFRANGDSWGW